MFRITPWLTNLGYQNCFISAAFIGMAASLAFLVMIKYGKFLRIKSATEYWTTVNHDKAIEHE
jgi:uncharacterized protein YqjF (DUF2071 family)